MQDLISTPSFWILMILNGGAFAYVCRRANQDHKAGRPREANLLMLSFAVAVGSPWLLDGSIARAYQTALARDLSGPLLWVTIVAGLLGAVVTVLLAVFVLKPLADRRAARAGKAQPPL